MGLAWGGHLNGRIGAGIHDVPNFSPLPGFLASRADGSQVMRTDAAYQLSGLMQAFYKHFNLRLTLSEGYRSIGIQNEYWRRWQNHTGNLAAYPGTSIHGWGLSADLAIEGGPRPTGAYLAWLQANAPLYGFINDVPSESWHWSYRTDLITRRIVVTTFVSNPNSPASSNQTAPPAKPTPPKPKPVPKKEIDMIYVKSKKSGTFYNIGEFSVDKVTKGRAQTYSAAVPGDTSLYQELNSAQVSGLIDDARKRRDALGLRVSDIITEALKTEDAPEK